MDTKKRQTAAQLREMLRSERGTTGGIIDALYDAGTFAELGAYIKHGDGNFESVIAGYGAAEERLVYTFIEDGSRDKGAFGEGAAKKISSLLDLAMKNGAPVVGIFDSTGAKITEGVGALAGYGSVIRKLSETKNIIPRIAVINGLCSGAMAVAARMFDIVITVKDKAGIFINPPSLVGVGTNPALTGLSDIAAEDMNDAVSIVKKLLDILPSGSWQVYSESKDNPNRVTPELETIVQVEKYNVRDVIAVIADNGELTELGGLYAPALVTCFIRLNGTGTGVVANNPAAEGGALTPAAAAKASAFIKLCCGLGMPVLTLVDTPGYDYNKASENTPYASVLASLSEAYASACCTCVTFVLGRAYGSAFTIMGSKSLGADIAFALECADISIMPPDSAVQLLYGDKIKESADPVSARAALLAEYKLESSSPVAAARNGDIDDIITYSEARQRVISAFEMLAFKV